MIVPMIPLFMVSPWVAADVRDRSRQLFTSLDVLLTAHHTLKGEQSAYRPVASAHGLATKEHAQGNEHGSGPRPP